MPTKVETHGQVGMRYGKLTLTNQPYRPDPHNKRFYVHCVCQCGAAMHVPFHNLVNGSPKSCRACSNVASRKAGCPEGSKKNPTYRSWKAMVQRCTLSTDPCWSLYGGRGITVCERWLTFENFLADMGQRPSMKHSIDRKDRNGNYEPDNCRWATAIEQNNNRRTNVYHTYQGKSLTAPEWARERGLPVHCVKSRLSLGWSIERALTEPLHTEKRTRSSVGV